MRNLLAAVAAGLVLGGGWAMHHGEPATGDAPEVRPAPRTVEPVRPVAHVLAVPTPEPTTTGPPERLEIDAIDVDASVEPVGITPDGGQEVPHFIDTVGWWREGVVPGAAGNAVIVGHTASAADGVFDRLGELEPGAEIRVAGPDGTVTFVVDRTRAVTPEQFRRASASIYRGDGPGGLVLLTCGDWNGREFETTTVVTASLA